jgi:hypothetical protein
MTRYTVVWDRDFERDLINTWAEADSETRAVLTAVADWADDHLVIDPDQQGQSEPEPGLRSVVVPHPQFRLAVIYQVVPEDRQVRVVRMTFQRG